VHVALEGGICVGKSVLLGELAEEAKKIALDWGFYPEPVQTWRTFGNSRVNVLNQMYKDPAMHSFLFQNIALGSKLHQLRPMHKKINIVERTISCQREVFIPLLSEMEFLDPVEMEVLDFLIEHAV